MGIRSLRTGSASRQKKRTSSKIESALKVMICTGVFFMMIKAAHAAFSEQKSLDTQLLNITDETDGRKNESLTCLKQKCFMEDMVKDHCKFLDEDKAYANALGGYDYDGNKNLIIPKNPNLVEATWRFLKNGILKQTGKIEHTEKKLWDNSFEDSCELHNEASEVAPLFREMVESVAKTIGAKASFGPTNYPLKTQESMCEKLNDPSSCDLSCLDKIARIRDVIRGSVIVKNTDQMKKGISTINELFDDYNAVVVWKDIFAENRPDGYVAKHANIAMSIKNTCGEVVSYFNISSEIQLHFDSIYNGKKNCPKERAHELYKPAKNITHAKVSSKLMYLSGMASIQDLQCVDPNYLRKNVVLDELNNIESIRKVKSLGSSNTPIVISGPPGSAKSEIVFLAVDRSISFNLRERYLDYCKGILNENDYLEVKNKYQTKDFKENELNWLNNNSQTILKTLKGSKENIVIFDEFDLSEKIDEPTTSIIEKVIDLAKECKQANKSVILIIHPKSGRLTKIISLLKKAGFISNQEDIIKTRYFKKEEESIMLDLWGLSSDDKNRFKGLALGNPSAYLEILKKIIYPGEKYNITELENLAKKQIKKNFNIIIKIMDSNIIDLLKKIASSKSLDHENIKAYEEDLISTGLVTYEEDLISTGLVTYGENGLIMPQIVKTAINEVIFLK